MEDIKYIDGLVSIIIPTYNREASIQNSIESILFQTYAKWELIIVDDCSSDNTVEVVKKYQQDDERINLVKLKNNSGACVARNEGIKLAQGEFVTFLDSDDEYFPDKIKKQIALFNMNKHSNLGVVSCGAIDYRDGKEYNRRLPQVKKNYYKALLRKEKRIGAGTPFLMVKNYILKTEGISFDPEMPAMQDWDFLIRICKKYTFSFVPDYLVKVNHHSNDRVYNSKNAVKALEIQYQKYGVWLVKEPYAHKRFVKNAAVIKAHHKSVKNSMIFVGKTLGDYKHTLDRLEMKFFKKFLFLFHFKYIKLFYMKYFR